MCYRPQMLRSSRPEALAAPGVLSRAGPPACFLAFPPAPHTRWPGRGPFPHRTSEPQAWGSIIAQTGRPAHGAPIISLLGGQAA